MKKRVLYYELAKYLGHKNALFITGMRQVGKTTLMKQIFHEVNTPKLWFDFENPLDTLLFENTNYDAVYEELLKASGSNAVRLTVFIDEIQNYPEITRIIKYHIDKYGVKYIATGSSNYYLKNLFPESLSGRKFLFVLNPLSFKEYLYFTDKGAEPLLIQNEFVTGAALREYKMHESDYNDYVEFGGFPEVAVTRDIDTKKLILRNIFSSFFEKDIKILSDLKDIKDLRDLILLLVPRAGNILDVSRLAVELGVNRPKLYGYFELLQGVFFIRLLQRYSVSIDRSVAGGRKVYFSDTGLLNTIGKVNEGQLFENAVANQLVHYGDLCYYNKRNKSEIDFIINNETGIEVKLKGTSGDLNKLRRMSDEIGLKKYFIVSRGYTEIDRVVFGMFL